MSLRSALCAAILAMVLADAPCARADPVEINGKSYELNATDAAALALTAARKAATKTSTPTVDEVDSYARLGKDIGASLASSAKEMGIAVNQFATTPIGKLAMVIIVYKLVGWELIRLAVGLLWLTVALPTWFWVFRRVAIVKSLTITPNEKGWRTKEFTFYGKQDRQGETQFGFLVILGFVLMIGMITIFG